MLDKIKLWAKDVMWNRVKYVLMHAVFFGAVAALIHLGFVYLPQAIAVFFAAYITVTLYEFGEAKGKAKAAGTFANTLSGNLTLLLSLYKSKWFLWQTLGASLAFLALWILLGVTIF